MREMMKLPFRLGTTSYIIPADIITNVRYLSGKVQDIELVLFEVDEDSGNLPSREQVNELYRIAIDNDLTYTIHLPLDLRLADDGSPRHVSLEKAHKVIDCTRELSPRAYVLHLDGKSVRSGATDEAMQHWQDQAVGSLEIVGNWAGGVEKLALENMEGYPLNFYRPVLERIAVNRTVDVGHLWLDHHNPVTYLQEALPRTRVIHVHGIEERDHQSLAYVPQEKLKAVMDELIRANYRGVFTVEVFSESDFLTSCAALRLVMSSNNSFPAVPVENKIDIRKA